jgi:hypothetical protein
LQPFDKLKFARGPVVQGGCFAERGVVVQGGYFLERGAVVQGGRSCRAVRGVHRGHGRNWTAFWRQARADKELNIAQPGKYKFLKVEKTYAADWCILGNPTFYIKMEDLEQWVRGAEEYCPSFLVRLVDSMQPYLMTPSGNKGVHQMRQNK